MYKYLLILILFFTFACKNETLTPDTPKPIKITKPNNNFFQKSYSSSEIATQQIYLIQLTNRCDKGDISSCRIREIEYEKLKDMLKHRKSIDF